MGQPVKLSDELVCDARVTADLSERSIAGQIEFWAQLGRAIEPILQGDRVLALRKAASERSLAEAVAAVDADEGRRRVAEYLESRPFPHFEPVAGPAGLLLKTDADGTRTVGKFVNRVFTPAEP